MLTEIVLTKALLYIIQVAVSDRYSFGIGIGRYIGISRYIGLADMGKAYWYQLSVSADKKVYIGRLPI